ncbi:MAG: TetR/AcrR family transcriptional regulator [Spirochaetales bacterium]|nr:TetR/AcrR family transcriptional regulator [Spirochaetales bacterium]
MKDIFSIKKKKKIPNVRERIIDTAIRLFYSQGIMRTGINQIISESHVAKASFYQHFPSKEDLIITCLNVYNITIVTIVTRLVSRSVSLAHFFKRWSRLILISAKENNTFNGCPIANIGFQVEPDNQRIKESFHAITSGWQASLSPLFQKAKVTGDIKADTNEDSFFREIMRINEGAFIMWKLTGDILYLKEMYSSFMRLLYSCH